MININVTGGELSQKEIDTYVSSAMARFPAKKITRIDFEVDGDYVNCAYHFQNQAFQRIRRITGYLVGTMDKWNNGKRAEERDRVKHGLNHE